MMKFGSVVQEMLLKDISWTTALGAILFGGAYYLCNFSKGHYEEHFCEIILNLNQLLRRCCLKKSLQMKDTQ